MSVSAILKSPLFRGNKALWGTFDPNIHFLISGIRLICCHPMLVPVIYGRAVSNDHLMSILLYHSDFFVESLYIT